MEGAEQVRMEATLAAQQDPFEVRFAGQLRERAIDSWQVRSSCPLFQSQPRTPRLLLPVVMPVKAAPAGCTSEQQLCG